MNEPDYKSIITKKDKRREPPPMTPATEATHALGTLVREAGDLSQALKALPKVEGYRSVWTKRTTDAMRLDTLDVVRKMENTLRQIRNIVEGTLRDSEEA